MHDVSIRILKPGDEQDLRRLLQLYIEVFKDRPLPEDTAYLSSIVQQGSNLFVAAFVDEALVGGLTAYILPSIYGNFNELYIYDVAVAETYQRHGIGSKLLDFMKSYGKTIGVTDMFVQADTIDTEARNFYKKNGGIEEDVRHYNFTIEP